MKYLIEVLNSKKKWKRIASFQSPIDRDDCLSFLSDKYSDCKFRKKDD